MRSPFIVLLFTPLRAIGVLLSNLVRSKSPATSPPLRLLELRASHSFPFRYDFLEGASFDTPSFYRLDFHITTAQPIFAISIRRTNPHTTISQDCLFGVRLRLDFHVATFVAPRNDISGISLFHKNKNASFLMHFYFFGSFFDPEES